MQEHEKDELFTIGGRDLMHLAQQQERIVKSQLLRKCLELNGYKQVARDLYRKGNEEEIKLCSHYGEQRYVNNNMPEDTGNIIQFMMNRMNADHKIIVNNELVSYCVAVQKCLDFENEMVTRKQIKSQRFVNDDNSLKKKGRAK